MELNELKPCPFCGGTKLNVETRIHDAGMSGIIEIAYVQCDECRATGTKVDDWSDSYEAVTKKKSLEELAIERWNRRANDGT